MQSRGSAAPATHPNPADILGQFYYAFGQGAGSVRVQREAIAALRDRYFEPIQASYLRWDAVAGNVLALISQVGRLAALLATQAGRTAIGACDFTQARELVEQRVREQELRAGPFCPFEAPDPAAELENTDDVGSALDAGLKRRSRHLH